MSPAIDHRRLAASGELDALESEIASLTNAMTLKEQSWIVFESVPGRPDRKVRKLKPGLDVAQCQREYAVLQNRMTVLLERKTELQRELGVVEEIYGTY